MLVSSIGYFNVNSKNSYNVESVNKAQSKSNLNEGFGNFNEVISNFSTNQNPFSRLLNSISSIFKYKQIMDYKEIGLTLSSYLEFKSIDDYKLKDLIIELNSITRDVSVFSDFYNIKNDDDDLQNTSTKKENNTQNIYCINICHICT